MANIYGLTNTTFPGDIQTFEMWQDLDAGDADAYLQYIQALANKQTIEAKAALNRIDNVGQKIMTSISFNTICDTLLACEKLYTEPAWGPGIQEFLNQFTYIGNWSKTRTYYMFNMVSYNNILYMNIGGTQSDKQPDINPSIWIRISTTSITNSSTVWRGIYNNSNIYQISDMVSHNNVWYLAIVNNPTEEPSANSTEWQTYLTFNQHDPIVSAQEPGGQNNGELWFKIIG